MNAGLIATASSALAATPSAANLWAMKVNVI
jgi:hypothetical protein